LQLNVFGQIARGKQLLHVKELRLIPTTRLIAAGRVDKPGKYDRLSNLTVTEAVAIAGGFNVREAPGLYLSREKHSKAIQPLSWRESQCFGRQLESPLSQ
jgi:hypothetical protein